MQIKNVSKVLGFDFVKCVGSLSLATFEHRNKKNKKLCPACSVDYPKMTGTLCLERDLPDISFK